MTEPQAWPDLSGLDPTHRWLTWLAHTHMKINGEAWSPARWLLDNSLPVQSWSPLPPRVKQGPPKHCYHNALNLAKRGRGRYVFVCGLATHMISTEHAWCIDRETGLIVDSTWESGEFYYGVPIRLDYAKACLRKERCPVWDWEGDYPIMTGAVPEEQWKEQL